MICCEPLSYLQPTPGPQTDTTTTHPTDTTVAPPADTTIIPAADTLWRAGCSVYGTVSCSGTGIPDVAVSDGYEVTVTDSIGRYCLSSSKAHGYIFISTPSGYEAPCNGVQPQFYSYLASPPSKVEKVDFELTECDQTQHTMLFFGDMHLAARMKDVEQFREFADDVQNTLGDYPDGPVYAMTLGDMAWDIFWYRYDLTNYLAEINRDLAGLPIFHTIGNHDHESGAIGDWNTVIKYKQILGPTYYSFNVGGVHYIAMDDILSMNTADERIFSRKIDDLQIDWLKRDLALVPHSTPVVVTMHSPVYYADGSVALKNGFNGFIKLFEGFDRVQVVTGHTHIIYNVDRLSSSVHVMELNSGAVCGGWWMTGYVNDIHLSGDGAPGGYRIMTADGSDLRWKFKGTSRDENYQFRSYDRNCIELSAANWCPNATANGKSEFEKTAGEYVKKSSDNYVLLNVWDWDPTWTIKVTENGKSLPVTQLSEVKDPLYLVSYEAYEYEHHYDDSVYYPAYTTNHMFRVKASSADSTLEIEVTDRFGRRYHESMRRPKEFKISAYR